MVQFHLWYILRRVLYSIELYDESYMVGKKQDRIYCNNIKRIADLLPADVKKDFLKDII